MPNSMPLIIVDMVLKVLGKDRVDDTAVRGQA